MSYWKARREALEKARNDLPESIDGDRFAVWRRKDGSYRAHIMGGCGALWGHVTEANPCNYVAEFERLTGRVLWEHVPEDAGPKTVHILDAREYKPAPKTRIMPDGSTARV